MEQWKRPRGLLAPLRLLGFNLEPQIGLNAWRHVVEREAETFGAAAAAAVHLPVIVCRRRGTSTRSDHQTQL